MTRNECNSLTEEMRGLLERSKIKNWHDNDALAWDGNNTISLKCFATHQVMDIEKVKRIFSIVNNTYIKSYNDFLYVTIYGHLDYVRNINVFLIRICIKYSFQTSLYNLESYKGGYVKLQEGLHAFIDDIAECSIS